MQADENIRSIVEQELERTTFQRKVVSYSSLQDTIDEATTYFKDRGYRSGRTGRPNQIFVMGGREGKLPRVTAEILIQTNVGKGKVTMVSISGAGEQLSQTLEAYADHLRSKAKKTRQNRASTDPEGRV